jgi:hypothetical protein
MELAETGAVRRVPPVRIPDAMPAAIAADQISYEDLYARWEQGNWRASELDFSVDR